MSGTFKQVEPLQIDDEIWCVLQDSAVPPVIQIEGLFTYEAALALRDWLIAATGGEGWIKCSERLPNAGVTVLGACGERGFVDTVRFHSIGSDGVQIWRDFVGKAMFVKWNPTHWMPLPAAPQVGKGEGKEGK